MEGLRQRFLYLSDQTQITAAIQAPKNLEEMIIFAAVDLDMSLTELIAVPEQDSFRYPNNARSFTSAQFVMEAYRQLGIFDDVEFNAAEFTVRDVYELAIFEDSNIGKPY